MSLGWSAAAALINTWEMGILEILIFEDAGECGCSLRLEIAGGMKKLKIYWHLEGIVYRNQGKPSMELYSSWHSTGLERMIATDLRTPRTGEIGPNTSPRD